MTLRRSPNVPDSEVSVEFLQAMVTRMETSYFKYGPVADAYPHKVNALACVLLRLDAYERDGNTEHLIEAANYLKIEFMHPAHCRAHFRPTSDRESPGRVWRPDEFDDAPEVSQRANDGSAAA